MDTHLLDRTSQEVTMPTVTVQKWGNSEGVRIPKELRERAGIVCGSKLDIEFRDGSIILTPSSVRTTQIGQYRIPNLEDMFRDYHGDYHGEEFDSGAAVGEEADF